MLIYLRQLFLHLWFPLNFVSEVFAMDLDTIAILDRLSILMDKMAAEKRPSQRRVVKYKDLAQDQIRFLQKRYQ